MVECNHDWVIDMGWLWQLESKGESMPSGQRSPSYRGWRCEKSLIGKEWTCNFSLWQRCSMVQTNFVNSALMKISHMLSDGRSQYCGFIICHMSVDPWHWPIRSTLYQRCEHSAISLLETLDRGGCCRQQGALNQMIQAMWDCKI